MVDVLDSIIDLNTAITEDDLEKAKDAVQNINEHMDELKERFEILDDDIGTYFGFYDTITKSSNDTGLYILNNLNGLKELYKNKIKWSIETTKLIAQRDNEILSNFVKETLNDNSLTLQDYQYVTLIRMINISQDYSLFALLKESIGDK